MFRIGHRGPKLIIIERRVRIAFEHRGLELIIIERHVSELPSSIGARN